MSEWTELKTLQEIAAAQARGDEIEFYDAASCIWHSWSGVAWYGTKSYRSRPKKKTKVVVLREGLFCYRKVEYFTRWTSDFITGRDEFFVRWLDTPPREIEVEE